MISYIIIIILKVPFLILFNLQLLGRQEQSA